MNERGEPRRQALLLIGPTGSGKSPLGDWLGSHGLAGRRCHHFDFGASLRAIATGTVRECFTQNEVQFTREIVEQGALLENESFSLAARILDSFVRRNRCAANDLLILNGLPRHVGQAEAVDRLLDVVAVVSLECTPHTVTERIRHDTGGDRAVRSDDTDALVAGKLATFAKRTRALVSHYADRGVPVATIQVGVDTQPRDIVPQLDRLSF